MAAESGPALLDDAGAVAFLAGAGGAGGGARFSLSLRSAFHVVTTGAATGSASGTEAWAAATGSAGRAGASTGSEIAEAGAPLAASRGRSAWGGPLRIEGPLRYQAPPPIAAAMATPMTTGSAHLPLPAAGMGRSATTVAASAEAGCTGCTDSDSAGGRGDVSRPTALVPVGPLFSGADAGNGAQPTEMVWPQRLHRILKARPSIRSSAT